MRYFVNLPWREIFWMLVSKGVKDECWLWRGHIKKDGYGCFGGHNTSEVFAEIKENSAHRIMYTLIKGPIPKGLLVRHTCDTPACVNPNHLVVGTHKENSQDMCRRDRVHKGPRPGQQKLSDKNVRDIRTKYRKSNGMELAKMYGVARSTIYCI